MNGFSAYAYYGVLGSSGGWSFRCIVSPCSEFCPMITCAPLLPRSATAARRNKIVMQSLEGFILAGGASSRMGVDKSELVLGGQTFVERVATALSAVTNTITVCGRCPANVQ